MISDVNFRLNVLKLNYIDRKKRENSWNTNINEDETMRWQISMPRTLNKKISTSNVVVFMVSSMLRHQFMRKAIN